MVRKKEKQSREELFKLMEENPDLPIVPVVDYRVVCDDFGHWLGAWGSSYIREYIMGKERVHYREDDDLCEVHMVLYEKLDKELYEAIETDTAAQAAYAELPWIKAIIVIIDLPG